MLDIDLVLVVYDCDWLSLANVLLNVLIMTCRRRKFTESIK